MYDDYDDEMSGYGEEIVPVGWDEDDVEGWEDDDDDLGYEDDLVGDALDDILEQLSGDDLVGARRYGRSRYGRSRGRSRYGRSRYGSRRPQRRPQRKPSGSRYRLKKVQAQDARRYPLGLGSTALAANATAVITVTPQLPFKVMRLITPSTNVTVDNIQVGTASQFVSAGGIPAEVFAPNAFGINLKGDTAVPGINIQVTVTDTSGAANTFTGAFFGVVAQ